MPKAFLLYLVFSHHHSLALCGPCLPTVLPHYLAKKARTTGSDQRYDDDHHGEGGGTGHDHDHGGEVERLDFDEIIDRCANWQVGDGRELKQLSNILRKVYNGQDVDGLEAMCLALLEHDQLPALYKAKVHTYLSAIEGYHEGDKLISATCKFAQIVSTNSGLTPALDWISEARTQQQAAQGWVSEEVEQWEALIAHHKVSSSTDLICRVNS